MHAAPNRLADVPSGLAARSHWIRPAEGASWIPEQLQDEMIETLPGLTWERVGHSHFIPQEEPEACARALAGWLLRLDGAKPKL
jgi:pimeloyl-ACP methyl ester carboxylesterase